MCASDLVTWITAAKPHHDSSCGAGHNRIQSPGTAHLACLLPGYSGIALSRKEAMQTVLLHKIVFRGTTDFPECVSRGILLLSGSDVPTWILMRMLPTRKEL
jgi:hypothetical protein